MGAKVYESVEAGEAASYTSFLRGQAYFWKAKAGKFREIEKVRFCERRMVNYRDLFDATEKER